MTRLAMVGDKVGHMDGGMKNWSDALFDNQYRLVQGHLDGFDSKITQ